jgi:hypothetical protein
LVAAASFASTASSAAEAKEGKVSALRTASDSNDLRMLLTPNKKVLSKKYTILLKQVACQQ